MQKWILKDERLVWNEWLNVHEEIGFALNYFIQDPFFVNKRSP